MASWAGWSKAAALGSPGVTPRAAPFSVWSSSLTSVPLACLWPLCPRLVQTPCCASLHHDLECAYTCWPCKHLMQGKCWLWFNFNNLIDLLKPTGLSKPIMGSLFCRPAERLLTAGPSCPCVWSDCSPAAFQGLRLRKPLRAQFSETSPTWDFICPFSRSWQHGLVLQSHMIFIYSSKDPAIQIWTYLQKCLGESL